MKPKKECTQPPATSRRSFISRMAAGTTLISLSPLGAFFSKEDSGDITWPADAPEYRFHMIGHGHIDPVWLWPWTEGISVVHSTFRSVLDRMNENPDFCFAASSSQFYEWVAENDPPMLKEIRRRVEEGRWDVVGGWWVEPDVNMPNGESLVRQGLYGQRTFERLLGRRATTGFNPDSFGHPGTLPQIYKLQGMNNYVFMRPGPHEKTIPADIFWWKGIDGTRVLTYRIPVSYNESGPVKKRVRQILEQFTGQPVKTFMSFYGVGDHGGGPTKVNIRSIEELKKEPGAPNVFFSTPDRYFKTVRSSEQLNLPVVEDDLQHHAVGCYTAESQIKKGNRLSEAALMTAEKLAAFGAVVWGADYPKDELTSAWKKVLFLQFHDSLAGTSVPGHSVTARNGYGYAREVANNISALTLQKLEWQVAAEDPQSEYLVVFNPHAWKTQSLVEYNFPWDDRQGSSRVEDEKGNPLPHQWGPGITHTGNRKNILIVDVRIPPMGYRQIRLRKGDAPAVSYPVKAKGNTLENENLRIKFSPTGALGIFDKTVGKEVFSGENNGCTGIVIDDPTDTWSHSVESYSNETGAFGNARTRILENGPLRAKMRVISTYGNSTLTIDWSLTAGAKKLDAEVKLDWQEKHKMLKLSFPVDVDNPEATYEVPYGHMMRAVNGKEDPGQRWIDLTGTRNGNRYGLTLINDAKYGYSISGNDMRISVVRSAVYAHHIPNKLDPGKNYIWMDQGIQEFKMQVVPHQGTWKEQQIPRLAEELVEPPLRIYQGIHKGARPKTAAFLEVDAPSIIIPAIKQAEDNEDMIVRCVESSGSKTTATIDLKFAGRKWTGTFGPNEIKTLRIHRTTGAIKEVNLLEE